MANLTTQTESIKEKEIKRQYYLVNAEGKILGRLASQIAKLLQGKNKVNYVPYLDIGDYVVVINAQKVKVSGKKSIQKKYTRYSGYPGGLKETTFSQLFSKNPAEVIKKAVWGMLPKNKLRKKMIKRLFISNNETHPFEEKIKLLN